MDALGRLGRGMLEAPYGGTSTTKGALDMARSGPASFAKRKRELEKKRKRQAKLDQRAERKAQKAQRAAQQVDDGGDPDLKGIVPGPQPPRLD